LWEINENNWRLECNRVGKITFKALKIKLSFKTKSLVKESLNQDTGLIYKWRSQKNHTYILKPQIL
jgi:hypothetical protein